MNEIQLKEDMKIQKTKHTSQLFIISLGILFFLITLSAFNVVNAQPQGGQQGPPSIPNAKQIKKMVAEVSKELSLNDEQQIQVSKLYVAHFEEVKKATSSGRPERSTMEALDTKFEREVNKVISPEQQKIFAAYQKKNKPQQMGGQRPNG